MSASAKSRKSWQQKLADSKDLPKLISIPPNMQKKWGTGTMYIPSPKEVDEIMRRIPESGLTTIKLIREELAHKHHATIACPMTTGIFAWIAAHAAHEAEAEGKKRITPYWRTLKSGGQLNEKYPGGTEAQAARLRAEGHSIEKGTGKRPPRVKDFEKYLVRGH